MRFAVPLSCIRAASRLPGALLLAVALGALPACSSQGEAPPGVAPAATPVAVARGRIDIEGGLLALSAAQAGTVARVAVKDGAKVHAGDLLVELDPRPAQLAVDAAQAEVRQARAQEKLTAVRLAAARQTAARLRAAAAAGAGDGQSADDATSAATQLAAEAAAGRAALELGEEKLAAARYSLGQRSLRAPVAGEVTQLAVQVGATVAPESGALVTLLPDRPRIVRAELNESFVGSIHPGMAADVEANDGAPGDHWAARVLRISPVYGPATLENDPQVRANSRTVECVLAFDQPQPGLRIGQRVLVRFGARGAAPAAGSRAPAPAATKG